MVKNKEPVHLGINLILLNFDEIKSLAECFDYKKNCRYFS